MGFPRTVLLGLRERCGFLLLSRRSFSRILSPDFFSSFLVGKSCQKRPFVHNSVCSQFLEGLFAIWLSVRNAVWGPSSRNSRGNRSLCWLGGGGVKGTEILNNNFVNKLAWPEKSSRKIPGKNPPKCVQHLCRGARPINCLSSLQISYTSIAYITYMLWSDASMHSAILLSGPGLHYKNCFRMNVKLPLERKSLHTQLLLLGN